MEEIKDKDSYLFILIVRTYEMAALQQMGKLKNPLTDALERNLEQAQFSIDLLDMLKSKTKGNLNDDESKFLENTLAQLKLNYVDEIEKEKKQTSTAKSESEVTGKETDKSSPEQKKPVS
jgi:uncharacterized protein DUF1844